MAITVISKSGFKGKNLFHKRRMMGLSLRDVGKSMGCTFNAVYAWEKGINTPNPKSLLKLSEVLKVKPDYFYKNAA